MKLETLIALNESIEHWERVVANPTEEAIGGSKCALCLLFNPLVKGSKAYVEDEIIAAARNRACEGCPVMARTGERLCNATPYYAVEALDHASNSDEYLTAAQAELDFLISLLPKDGIGAATS
jgi:hypothetical protein